MANNGSQSSALKFMTCSRFLCACVGVQKFDDIKTGAGPGGGLAVRQATMSGSGVVCRRESVATSFSSLTAIVAGT